MGPVRRAHVGSVRAAVLKMHYRITSPKEGRGATAPQRLRYHNNINLCRQRLRHPGPERCARCARDVRCFPTCIALTAPAHTTAVSGTTQRGAHLVLNMMPILLLVRWPVGAMAIGGVGRTCCAANACAVYGTMRAILLCMGQCVRPVECRHVLLCCCDTERRTHCCNALLQVRMGDSVPDIYHHHTNGGMHQPRWW